MGCHDAQERLPARAGATPRPCHEDKPTSSSPGAHPLGRCLAAQHHSERGVGQQPSADGAPVDQTVPPYDESADRAADDRAQCSWALDKWAEAHGALQTVLAARAGEEGEAETRDTAAGGGRIFASPSLDSTSHRPVRSADCQGRGAGGIGHHTAGTAEEAVAWLKPPRRHAGDPRLPCRPAWRAHRLHPYGDQRSTSCSRHPPQAATLERSRLRCASSLPLLLRRAP
mmetsp:Transcript_77255/g.153360  ORF Transcript_77255/g.153360 Transcript_77255/m.153360 type:complete len:228 (+) Transcript_77255:620-1303(+)